MPHPQLLTRAHRQPDSFVRNPFFRFFVQHSDWPFVCLTRFPRNSRLERIFQVCEQRMQHNDLTLRQLFFFKVRKQRKESKNSFGIF